VSPARVNGGSFTSMKKDRSSMRVAPMTAGSKAFAM
jgi:hypothetical protein